MLDFLNQSVLLCYFPLFMVVLGFIAYAAITDGDARRTYLRRPDTRSEIEQLAMPSGAPSVNVPASAETPSGMALRFAEHDAVEVVAAPSVASASPQQRIVPADSGATNTPLPAVAQAAAAVVDSSAAAELDLANDEVNDALDIIEDAPISAETSVVIEEKAAVTPPPKAQKASGNVAQTDLRKIEGIGPKINSVLQSAGITTFTMLAAKTPDEIRLILTAAGINTNANNPETWSEQAALAAAQKWDELERLQDSLTAGRRK